MIFTSSYTPSAPRFIATTNGSAPLVDFNASLPTLENDGTEQPPVNPSSPGVSTPPLPLAYQTPGYTYPNFDPDLLPRLQNKASTNILTSVTRTVFKVNGIDYGNHFLNGDYQRPIAGSGTGQVTLACHVTNSDYSLTYDTFKPYQRYQWRQVVNGVEKIVSQGWLIAAPTINVSNTGIATLSLTLGDELELYANRYIEPDRLYCGDPPKTAGEAARIYADYNRLQTTAYPVGHTLVEAPQKFVNDKPWDFLQLLYSPTNQDVRCNKQGFIEVVPRPSYDPDNSFLVTHLQTLEVPTEFTKQYRPYTKVRVQNQFLNVGNFDPSVDTRKTVNGLPTNTSPWFQNGYTETLTTTYTIGSTVTFTKEEFYGYVPVTFPIAKTSTSSTGCSVSPIATEWRLITTKTFALGYYRHISGSYLVWKKENWLEGLKLQENPANPAQYILFNGTQEYSIETYTNVPQVNPKVCRKDYTHYKLRIEKQEFKLNADFELILTANSLETYSPQGKAPSDPDFYIGVGQRWYGSKTSGEYSEELDSWINQPTDYFDGVTPPNSEWVRPNTRDTQAYLNYESPTLANLFDETSAPTQSAPCCFTNVQLRTYADRYLREQYGLANAITIVIPDRYQITVGTHVRYLHPDGSLIPYLVYAEETNQTGCQSTRTLTLIKTY